MLMLFMLAVINAGAPPVTDANWKRHPAVKRVHALTAQVDALIAAGSFTRSVSTNECGGLESTIEVMRINDGVGVRLVMKFRRGESAFTLTATYDRAQIRRSLVVEGNNGAHATTVQRSYWDERAGFLYRREEVTGDGLAWWRPSDAMLERLRDPGIALKMGACNVVGEPW